MAGPLNPEWHSEIPVEIPVSDPLERKVHVFVVGGFVKHFWHHDMIRRLYLALSLCVISHVIVSVVISSMYSQVMQRQV